MFLTFEFLLLIELHEVIVVPRSCFQNLTNGKEKNAFEEMWTTIH